MSQPICLCFDPCDCESKCPDWARAAVYEARTFGYDANWNRDAGAHFSALEPYRSGSFFPNEEGWLYSLTSDDLAALPRMAEDMFWIAKAAKKGGTP